MTILIKLLGVVLFGVLALATALPLAGIPEVGPPVVLGFAVVVCSVVLFARSGRHSWAWGFVLVGAALLLMPLVVIPMLSSIGVELYEAAQAPDADPEGRSAFAVWVVLGAPFAWVVFSFVGLLVGAVFLLLGLVLFLSGQKEVVIVQRQSRGGRASRPSGARRR